MRVFVTGATGFIGSEVVKELVGKGHQVLGLARSDAGAKALAATGATVQRGDLDDLDGLRRGAAESDAVIHTAFNHDFSKFAANSAQDKRAIEVMGTALEGSNRPFIVTSGLVVAKKGLIATEDDGPIPPSETMPRASEVTGAEFVARGVKAMTVRLPQVHDVRKQGLISYAIMADLQKGVSAYVGDGSSRFAAVHVLDAAHLYCLALEKGAAGARYHAVAEEGVPMKEIAEALGRRLNLPVASLTPEKAPEHFGFLAHFMTIDLTGSSQKTRKELGWEPKGRGLIADLDELVLPEA